MKNVFPALTLLFVIQFASAQDAMTIDPKYGKEVTKTVKNKNVKKAFDLIDQTDSLTVAQHIELTEIPAPPFGEENRGSLYTEMIKAAGANKVWTDEVGNVLAMRAGKMGGRTVVLDAHLDTVFPIETNVTVRQSGDTLFAPGIGDDTRGLAMVLSVFRAFEQAGIQTDADVLFVASVGEEGPGDLRGVKHLFREDAPIKIDSWISIDGGDLGRVNNGALGSVRYRVTIEGPGGHSWGAFGLANPHHAMGRAIDLFSRNGAEYSQQGPKTSFNVGRIGGGTSVNSIPYESWFEVDMRSLVPERLNEMEAIFKKSVTEAVEEYNASGVLDEVTVKFEKIGDRPSGTLSADLPLIQRAAAVTKEFGGEPKLTTGSTNSNIPISMGIPSVTLGRGGRGGNAHALDEWWANKGGSRAIKLALLLTVMEAGLAD